MSTKVEQASTVESRHVQTAVTASSSAASTSSPKISMFAAKSGFVIPKNKLSGSLVPIFRGGKKPGSSDAADEESTKPVQRKTKWGPDLTQDAAVRRGRAFAYQTRVDQIMQQLKLGILDIGDNQDSTLASQIPDRESSGHQINSESELLELERREAIGEIIKLNPSYKAPAEYRPLLKEAKVPIPIKEYPGYNFVGLIFGPASDTQKRLEKETGAKIQVYGTKADTGEKGEITPSDGNEFHGAYEELYVHVSADAYEKVDAAVALIELLVTPVSVNPVSGSTTSTAVSGNNVNVINLSQGTPTPYTIPSAVVNQGLAQPIIGSAHAPPHGQFQPYPGPWFPTGPPSGFIAPQNPSAPILRNPVQVSSSPLNPSNMPSLFGPRPVLAAGFSSVTQSPSLFPYRPQPPLQVLQRPYMPQAPPLGHIGPPRNPPLPASLSTPTQPNVSAPPPFTANQPTPTGPPQIVRPLPSSLPQSAPPVTFSNQPLTPAGSSTGWSRASAGTPASLGLSNMVWMAPLMVPPQGPHPVASQPIVMSGAPPLNRSAGNMVSPITLPLRSFNPQLSGAAANRPIAALALTSVPQPQVGLSLASSSLLPTPAPAPTPTLSSSIAPMQPVNPSLNPVVASTPIPSPAASTSTPPPPPKSGIPSSASGSGPSFTPIRPPSVTAPKPQHPSSSDFTFQPHRPQNPASLVVPRPGSQPVPQTPPNQMPQAPHTPSFRPAMHNSTPLAAMQGSPRPQISNQMSQPRAQIPNTFVGNLTVPPAPLRHPAFLNPSPASPAAPVPQMGPRNLSPAPQMINSAGPFRPRPGNPVQLQQNYPATATRPQSLLAPNQQFNSNLSFVSGKPASSPSGPQQIYDPFSPTSVPQLGANPAKVRKQESDPEYEDLMASVGVK